MTWAGCSSSSAIDAGGGSGAASAGRSGATGAGGAASAGHGAGAGQSSAGTTAKGLGTIAGTVRGSAFDMVTAGFWIGKPDQGALPTQVYLTDAALDCAAISSAGWDKTIGNKQVLEMDLGGTAPATFTVGVDADANYSGGAYNPSADNGGTITVSMINAGKNIVGSFELKFAGEALTGAFDAPFCAEGVEP